MNDFEKELCAIFLTPIGIGAVLIPCLAYADGCPMSFLSWLGITFLNPVAVAAWLCLGGILYGNFTQKREVAMERRQQRLRLIIQAAPKGSKAKYVNWFLK